MTDILWNRFTNSRNAFIIAEAGVNHNGRIDIAMRMVDVAVDSGVDAVKFQTFKSDSIVTMDAPKANYQKQTTEIDESQLDMLRRLELSYDAHRQLFDYCQKKGILFLSTPFDIESAAFLNELGVELFKISSGDLTNLPFLAYLAGFKKKLVLSTGMACLGEIETALTTIDNVNSDNKVVLLHCVSDYPAHPKDINLKAMDTLRMAFHRPVGFSDHSQGFEIAIAATALGACIIEKHFTLDRNMPGPDHKASIEPHELNAMVNAIRKVELALGNGLKKPVESEKEIAKLVRKSIVSSQFIKSGDLIRPDMISVKRPGTGLAPAMLPYIVGRRAIKDIQANTVLTLDMVE